MSAFPERPLDLWRGVDFRLLKHVGDYQCGGLWLRVEERRTELIHRWEGRHGKWKFRTLGTLFGPEKDHAARLLAMALIEAERKQLKRMGL
jgi:hypothetical protein